MISCTLGNKTYTVDFVSGRALREIDDAAKMCSRVMSIAAKAAKGETADADGLTIKDAMDVMIRWFCLLFGNQFTPDDVLDKYPVDCIMRDITTAIVAVETQTTEVLSEFPIQAAQTKTSV